MSELSLKQIKEEERTDKILKFLAKNKSVLKKLALLTIIIAIILTSFKIIKNNLTTKYSSILHQSLLAEEVGNFDKSKEKLQKIYNARFAPISIKSIAMMKYANILLLENKKEQAVDLYKEIAFNNLNDDFIQENSALLATKLIISDIKTDSSEKFKQETEEQIKKLTNVSKTLNSYFLEQSAIFYIKIDNKKEARKILEQILRDQKIPQTLKNRVLDLIKLT